MIFVTDALCGEHLREVAHPESPARVEGVARLLRERGVLQSVVRARDATDEELLLVHTPDYLELVERESAEAVHPRYLSTGDVVIDEHSHAAARRAAGGAIVAMEQAVETSSAAFALIRPPGHHAEPDRGMGFCLFNNAAVAARVFQRRYGGRVLIVDVDYHHGNGTQAVAGNGLSYLSTHAWPAYPGTGGVEETLHLGDDIVMNLPLPVTGVTTEYFAQAWRRLLPQTAQRVGPDLLVVSAGFDYVQGDPVGDLGVGVEAASELGACIAQVAASHCKGRVVYVLEGGYVIEAIAESIARIANPS